jgi:hypothetical protein
MRMLCTCMWLAGADAKPYSRAHAGECDVYRFRLYCSAQGLQCGILRLCSTPYGGLGLPSPALAGTGRPDLLIKHLYQFQTAKHACTHAVQDRMVYHAVVSLFVQITWIYVCKYIYIHTCIYIYIYIAAVASCYQRAWLLLLLSIVLC